MTALALLMNAPAADCEAHTGDTRFGGRPSAPDGRLAWPVCASCEGNMQFLGQLRTEDGDTDGDKDKDKDKHGSGLLLLFMCQNDPGGCDEWDAEGGGNRVIAVPAASLRLVRPPADGDTLRPVCHGAAIREVEADGYEAARQDWIDGGGRGRDILGHAGGEPSWLQGDETPSCDACGDPIAFVAQVEEGLDAETAMNFGGGGCAYVFRCACDGPRAKMLWQC